MGTRNEEKAVKVISPFRGHGLNMAKCSVCKKVKGKRRCLAFDGVVCSSCCGASRAEAACAGCSFFGASPEMRRYDKTPYFSTQQMADNPPLEAIGNVIEGAMCSFDLSKHQTLPDELCKRVTERLLDRYAFGDQAPSFLDDLEKEGFACIESAISQDLPDMAPDLLGKVLGTVYRSIKRHANGHYRGRSYLDFIHQYVGIRIASGVRAMPE